MAKLADVRLVVKQLNTVLEGRWQPMFWNHFEYLMDCLEEELIAENPHLSLRWEAMFGPEIALGKRLDLELGKLSEDTFNDLQLWLYNSVYYKEIVLNWTPPDKSRSCN